MTIVLHLFFGLNGSSLGLWLFMGLVCWVFWSLVTLLQHQLSEKCWFC